MTNRNSIIALILLLTMIVSFCFTSCHGKLAPDEPPMEDTALDGFIMPEGLDSEKTYEITFWAKNDSNKTQAAIYRSAINEFQSYYPNIKVNLKLYTDYGRIYNDVITNIATDTTPNVCITYPDHIATYKTGEDVVVPLDILMRDEEYGLGGSKVAFDAPTEEEIVPQFLSECMIDGHYYAMPYMRSTEACYINKTYVEKLGYKVPDVLTWDFIWEVAEAAMEMNDDGTYKVNGKKVMIPVIYKSTDNMMIQMLNQQGGGYSDDNGNVKIFNSTTKDILAEIEEQASKKTFSTFKISSYPANFLNAGECIFAIDSTAGATWMGSNAPLVDIDESRLVEFETVVKTVPQYDTENISMISQGPSVCIFDKDDSGEVLASWLFVQYLLTNSVQIAYAKTEGYVPVTLKAQNSAEYTEYISREGEDNDTYYDIKIKATKLLIDNVDKTFVTPVFNGSTSLRDAAGYMIETVVKDVRRGKDVDFEKIFTNAVSLYRLEDIVPEEGDEQDPADTQDKLPPASVVLISVLVTCWVAIAAYVIWEHTFKKSRQKR